MPGFYWFAKTGDFIPFESRLEMSVLVELDYERDVAAVAAQPFRLDYRRGRKPGHHVPDFLVRLRSGSVRVVDVKPAAKVHDPANQAVFEITRTACGQAGWDYAVVTGPEPQVWANLSWLAGYRRVPADPFNVANALVAGCRRSMPLGELVESAGPPALVRAVLFHLLWSQRLNVDISQPLDDKTLVRGPAEASRGA